MGAVWQPWDDGDGTSQQQLTAADRVLGADDAETVSLEVAGAETKVVRSKSEGRAVLVATGMPPAPSGKVYELWLQDDDGTPRSRRPDAEGLRPHPGPRG